MSETKETSRTRKPWWVLGTDLVTSPIATVFFGFMLWRTIVRYTEDPSGWDVVYGVGLVALVGCGLASIVYYIRHPELRYNIFEGYRP